MRIEFQLADMEEGRGAGTHVHRRSQGEPGWCRRHPDPSRPSTRKGEKPTYVEVSREEAEENLVRARREYEDAKARLINLERIVRATLSGGVE